MGHRLGAIAVGFIACAVLVVTFTSSLGAIASRGDTNLAERSKAVDPCKDDQAQRVRITAERSTIHHDRASCDRCQNALKRSEAEWLGV
jgi:hypothetical protein